MAINVQEIIDKETGGKAGGMTTFSGEQDLQTSASSSVNQTPVTNDEVSTVITSDQLESSAGNGVVMPPVFTPARFETDIPEESAQQKELSKLEDDNKQMRDDIAGGIRNLGDIADFTEGVEGDVDFQRKREAKTAINNKIRKKERDFDLALRDAQDAFGTRAQKNAIKNEITKNFNRELADLSIIQMARAGEFNDAQATVNRKVELEMQGRRAELDALTFLFTENKDRLSTIEQREFDAKIQSEERVYQEELGKRQTFENFKLSLIETAINNGAGNGVLDALQRSDHMGSLLAVKGVQGPATGGGSLKAPTVKSINGVDMQWNGTAWEEIDTQQQVAQLQSAVDKFDFLRETVKEAKRLTESAGLITTPVGPTLGTKAIGSLFIGDTSFQQLQGLQDTIQTNMLTMSGDPNIRDFFGPQMSEADVRMMVSGGTTLNNSTMSNEQYLKELNRIDDFLNRGQTGAKNKLSEVNTASYNVITAPDGTQVEIID